MTKLNKSEVKRWQKDRGDYIHNIDYDLDSNSVVMDLGGYTGKWATVILEKYNPNIYILEPVPSFYKILQQEFLDNDRIKLLNAGISSENRTGVIFLNGDASSSSLKSGESVKVEFVTIDFVLNLWNIQEVDLMQINIEGEECLLLEDIIKKNLLRKFKNLQIQFHMVGDYYETRRNNIRQALLDNNFSLKFDYPFVWECWTRI